MWTFPFKGSSKTKIRLSYSSYDTTVSERTYATGVTEDLFDMGVDYYQLGGIKVFSEGKVETYGMGTLGVTHFSPRNFADPSKTYSSETLFSMNFGLGMNMMLSKRFGLNLQGVC